MHAHVQNHVRWCMAAIVWCEDSLALGMRSLESLNQALGVLHHWNSDMSLAGGDDEDIDAKIAAACLYIC